MADRIREVTGGAFTPLQVTGNLTDDDFPKKLIDSTIFTYKRLDILGNEPFLKLSFKKYRITKLNFFKVNNTGGATEICNFDSSTLLEKFDSCFKLNVRSVVMMTQLAVPWLAQTRGCVINM